jgi:hypothetical protein
MTSPTRSTRVHENRSVGPSSKIASWHLDRLAVVYVRQSTAQQVLVHTESTRLQYGLVSRAEAYGWASDRIVVIDDESFANPAPPPWDESALSGWSPR